jgi:ATP-dependent Clp protease adaptor protein ClpS
METIIEKKSEESVDTKNPDQSKIVILNDEINTFDHVILTLMETCEIDIDTAITIAMKVHTSGSAVAKTGETEDMENRCILICLAGINAVVEKC